MSAIKSLVSGLKSKLRAVNIGAIEYCINDEHFHTVIQLFLLAITQRSAKQLSEVDHFIIKLRYRDKSGKTIHTAEINRIATDACIHLDSWEFLGRTQKLEGSVEYELIPIRKDGSAIGPFIHPIEPAAYLFWTDDKNTLTSTHMNHITTRISPIRGIALKAIEFVKSFRAEGARVYPGAVALWCDDRLKSSFLIQNGRFSMSKFRVEIRNSKGESRFAAIHDIAPYELREVFTDDLIPDLRLFADAGFVELVVHDFPIDIANKRLLIKTYHQANGSFSIDHSFQVSAGKLNYSQPDFTPEEQRTLGKGAFFPHTIEHSPETKTILAIYNCEYENTSKDFGLTIFKSDGTKHFEDKKFGTIPTRGFSIIDFSQLIHEPHFQGHFEVYYGDTPNTGKGTVSSLLHGQVFYTHPNGIEANQVGSAIWNLKPKANVPSRVELERASVYFMPFWLTSSLRSRIHISNVGCFDEDVETVQLDAKLIDENGNLISKTEISIQPMQSIFVDETYFKHLNAEFKGVIFFELKNERGALPMHFDVVDSKSRAFASDHALGG